MAKNDNSYHAQKDKEQIKKLDQLLDELPKFCKTFFRGIEQTTSSSTRLGYAYDLRIFFNFIREKNPLYKNKELYEIDLTYSTIWILWILKTIFIISRCITRMILNI